MASSIVPQISETLRKLMGQIDERLKDVDLALSEKLDEEEHRWESMVDYFQNSL